MARAPALLALLCAAAGGVYGVPPPTRCQSGDTELSCQDWAPPGTDMCASCQQVIALLIRMANESATKAAVEGFLWHECAALPVPAMVPPCQELMHQYWSLLLTDIEGRLKPSAVCARLELCPGQAGGGPALSLLEAVQNRPQGALPVPRCWLCRSLVARLEAAVPRARVAEAVAALCRALPLAAAGACQCLAQRYAALALERALARLGPALLCRALLGCRQEAPTPRELRAPAEGGDGDLAPVPPPLELSPRLGPCVLGPTYWCSSPAAAQRCQALQHCQEHVWL
ncbi:pulmonary surfactant-associated protein B [Lathamus discolor]|uniref:pulmonary surfactant-associated protein B n=1 Tax=Lathamus discolor TaxID=678569 RepID=UPI0032B77267